MAFPPKDLFLFFITTPIVDSPNHYFPSAHKKTFYHKLIDFSQKKKTSTTLRRCCCLLMNHIWDAQENWYMQLIEFVWFVRRVKTVSRKSMTFIEEK